MHRNAADLAPSRQQPQRILQRLNVATGSKAAFLWGSTPFLWPRSKKWGGTVGATTLVVACGNTREGGDALPYKFFFNGRGYPTLGTSRTPSPYEACGNVGAMHRKTREIPAAQPTALSPPVSGREANPRSAMHRNAAGLVPTRHWPQRILQRDNVPVSSKSGFTLGLHPVSLARSKKWGGTGTQPPRWLQTARQGRAGTPSPTSSFLTVEDIQPSGRRGRRPLQSTRQRGCDITHVPASSAAQPTALLQPVSGREANPRSAMHKGAADLAPTRHWPQRILQRNNVPVSSKSGFPLGLHPISLAKIKEMGWNGLAATPVVANGKAREGGDALPYKTREDVVTCP